MSAKVMPVDAARVKLLLGQLRLPAIALAWPDLAATADREGWPAARFLVVNRWLQRHGDAGAEGCWTGGEFRPAEDAEF
jgi:hypothetical protein